MNEFIKKNIEKIILVFLYMQPLLDVTTGISLNYGINITISSIIRLIFFILCTLYLIKNKKYIIFLVILLMYLILFSTTIIIYKDISALSYEIKNTLNTLYLPVVLLTLYELKNKVSIKNIFVIYMIYIALILIPNITNTGFNSYEHSKLGSIGWFNSANAVGNILSILLPFVIYYLIKKKNILLTLITILTTIYTFSTMGTKVPILSLIICIIFNLLYFFIKWIKNKNYKNIIISIIISIIIFISSIILIPKTNFYKNIEIHKNYLGINNITEVFTNYKFFDHFIFSERLTFLNNTHKNYIKSNLLEKISGIGYIENYGTDNVSIKTIEIDYFEIFYRNGIIVLGLYIYSIYKVLKNIDLKEKKLINLEYKTSIILIFLLALFSGHILINPAVSIFVSLIFVKGGSYEKISEG